MHKNSDTISQQKKVVSRNEMKSGYGLTDIPTERMGDIYGYGNRKEHGSWQWISE